MSNKKRGNKFERELAKLLSQLGCWVHLLQSNANGQPADIIACKGGKAYLIDAKVCDNSIFQLSRVEDNQLFAMWLWESYENGTPWFALKLHDDRILMVSYDSINEALDEGRSRLTYDDIVSIGKPFDRWGEKL